MPSAIRSASVFIIVANARGASAEGGSPEHDAGPGLESPDRLSPFHDVDIDGNPI